MTATRIEPIEPLLTFASASDAHAIECDGCQYNPGFWTGLRNFYRPPLPRSETSEGYAAGGPRLWLDFRRDQVEALNALMYRDGWEAFHALGVYAWQQERVASIGVRVIDGGTPSVTLVVGPATLPSAYLDKPWQRGGRVRLSAKVGGSAPWGLNTFLQVLDHELRHWMGSIYGSGSADQHTDVQADLMARRPVPRTMWTKHDPNYQTYYGRSLRELAWERTKIGQPLVAT